MLKVNINIPEELINITVIKTNLEDIINLLKKYFTCELTINCREYDLLINITNNNNPKDKNVSLSYKAECKTIDIEAKSPIDIVYGFYFFMTDVLGFVFLHPEEIIIPNFDERIFQKDFTLEATSNFNIRGFHLHTLHPIELTHFLFEESEQHKDYIKKYINHLVRLGQNTFQFYLLERTDLKTFIPYISEVVEYAHAKGVKVGIMCSLFRIQQYSYKLFSLMKILNLVKYVKKQIDSILYVPFDYIVIESPLGEFLPDLMRYIPNTIKKIEDYIIYEKNTPLYYSKHIVKKDHRVMEPIDRIREGETSKANFLFRTVMCFSLLENSMGAYENKSFSFVYNDMERYNDKKQIVFWPTAAYWVCFDNSVPLFLFPYLKSRFDDCRVCKDLQIYGHLTFSSGFEWGGALIELAVASYSWDIRKDGELLNDHPLKFLKKIAGDSSIYATIKEIYDLTNNYLMNNKLLIHITAEDPFLEFPFFNHTFQPRPEFSLKYIRRKIKKNEISKLIGIINELTEFSDTLLNYLDILEKNIGSVQNEITKDTYELIDEIFNYLKVLTFRINHKINIYYAALCFRRSKKRFSMRSLRYLVDAKKLRLEAFKVIEKVKNNFRYDEKYISKKIQNRTSYEFSYFYPAAKLFFWEREEKELLYNKFNPFFMKLWNFLKILGLR